MSESNINRNKIAYIYNPQNQSQQELIDSFVVRLGTFKRIYAEIESAKMEYPEQHLLIEGKRGMGKTTLLLRLAYQIQADENLKDWLLPLVFNEEEYSIRRLFGLWEKIILLLEDNYFNEFGGLYEQQRTLSRQTKSDEEYEQLLLDLVLKALRKQEKKIILFIDNFGDVFQKFNDKEARRLRKILQTVSEIRIIAASSRVLEFTYQYKHPFYEFFKVYRLTGLNAEETQELMLKLSENYRQEAVKTMIRTQKGRIEALRRITGGVIRTMVLLFEIFVDDTKGNAFTDLEKILDSVTPLYKHRMDDLPAQQQAIVEAIALEWDAIGVKEIARQSRMESKKVSAQMALLVKNEIVDKKPTSNKNHFYQLNERFFNIWYLMRHGRRGDERRVRWLVRFFEEWCDEDLFKKRVSKHIGHLQSGDYNIRAAYFMTEALAKAKYTDEELQHTILSTGRAFLSKQKSDLLRYVSQSDKEIYQQALGYGKEGSYEKALTLLLKLKKKDVLRIAYCYERLKNTEEAERYYLKAIEKGDIDALYNLASLYDDQNKLAEAESYYLRAIEKGDIDALNNLAILYKNQNKLAEAESYYLRAIEKGNIGALNNLANLYADQNKLAESESYYLKAIEKGHIGALYNLAILYQNQNKLAESESYYLKAIEKGHIGALYNLAILYQNQNKLAESESYYLKAIEQGNIDALNNLAILYQNQNKLAESESYYLKAIEKGHIGALYNLANLYQNQNKLAEAESYYLRAIEKGHIGTLNNLAILYKNQNKLAESESYYLKAIEKGDIGALYNLAILYENQNKLAEAESYYLRAIEKGHISALYNLAILYENQNKLAEAESYYLRAIEKGHIDALYNLAILYQNQNKLAESESYYLRAIEKGYTDSLHNLSWMYFQQKREKNKALEFTLKANFFPNDFIKEYSPARILVWNHQFEEGLEYAKKFWYEENYLEERDEYISLFLLLLLAKKQYAVVYDYFTSSKGMELEVKDRFKPIWYALMFFMKEQYPNEYLRMGSDLEETVQEIVQKVEQMAVDYA